MYQKVVPRLNEKLSVTSVSALDRSCDTTKFIGPIGDNQFNVKPVVDLIFYFRQASHHSQLPIHSQNQETH